MARAKQTNRAEARKRYRQANQLTDPGDDELLDDATGTAAATSGNGRPVAKLPAPKPSPSNGVQRPGITTAFRAAYHPAHVREDLRHLPEILLNPWLALGLLIVVAAGAALVAYPTYSGSVFLFEQCVWPAQAIAPLFLVGLFAKRASYLQGLVVGLVQFVVFAGLTASGLIDGYWVLRTGQVPAVGALIPLLLSGVVWAVFMTAAAAWYRRFLRESSPRRVQPGRPGAKPAPRRAASRR